MLAISFIIMYSAMSFNVDEANHILSKSHPNLYVTFNGFANGSNHVINDGKMYPDKKLNGIIIVASIVVFVTTLSLLRTQTPVSDVQYMKAMIPHHSSAIMTSKNANIKDPEVKKLSEG